MNVPLAALVSNKISVNRKRYVKDLCVAKKTGMPKYTEFSSTTGVSKDDNIIMFTLEEIDVNLSDDKNLQELHKKWLALVKDIKEFSRERGWLNSYDEVTLRLSLAAEVGELAELLQWNNDNKTMNNLPDKTKTKLCEEIADVAIYGFHYHRSVYGEEDNGSFLVE